MQNFNRKHPQVFPVVYDNMELFLELCGLPKKIENFILEQIDGEWHGRNVSSEELILTTFHLVGTDKFVTFDAYKKIIA